MKLKAEDAANLVSAVESYEDAAGMLSGLFEVSVECTKAFRTCLCF